MEPFVTIAEFTLPSDLMVARVRLEDEGLECRTRDEFTVQVHNLYSQAIGGVKLQVREAQADEARARLVEWGFILPGKEEPGRFWSWFATWSEKVPILCRIDLLVARALAMLGLLLFIVAVPLGVAMAPAPRDLLTSGMWCIDEVFFDQEWLEPASTSLHSNWVGCGETLSFDIHGRAYLPGFGTPAQHVDYQLDGNRLYFEGTEALHPVYKGVFKMKVTDHELLLHNDRTYIRCSRYHYSFGF